MRCAYFSIFCFVLSATLPCFAQTPGSVADWDAANNPATDPTTDWEDSVNSVANLDWQFGGGAAQPTLNNGVVSSKTTIASTYSFDGNDTATMGTDWPGSNADATIEMWIRPNDLVGNEVLLDIGGGGDGASFRLEGNMLHFFAEDGSANRQASATLPDSATGDFIQIVGQIDLVNDLVNLYVDGMFADMDDTGGTPFNDYAGSDANALGNIGGTFSVGGTFSPFDGDIAIVRLSDSILGPQAIEDNFNDLLLLAVPEPTSIAIWSLLGLAFTGYGYYHIRRKK